MTLKQKEKLFDSTTEPQCLHFSENQSTNGLSLVIIKLGQENILTSKWSKDVCVMIRLLSGP